MKSKFYSTLFMLMTRSMPSTEALCFQYTIKLHSKIDTKEIPLDNSHESDTSKHVYRANNWNNERNFYVIDVIQYNCFWYLPYLFTMMTFLCIKNHYYVNTCCFRCYRLRFIEQNSDWIDKVGVIHELCLLRKNYPCHKTFTQQNKFCKISKFRLIEMVRHECTTPRVCFGLIE